MTENSVDPKGENRHRYKRSHHHSRKRRPRLKRYIEWAKNNSIKFIALIFSVALIYITILFFTYDKGKEKLDDPEKKTNVNNPVKGILLPMRIFNENSPLRIYFGGKDNTSASKAFETTVSLAELSRGYTVSLMNFINCSNETKPETPLQFILSVEGNRLYVSAEFTSISDGKTAGVIDKNYWKLLSKKIAAFHSNDELFEVTDHQGNVMFNMQFIQPDLVSINGYFVGSKCIYITGDSGIHVQQKEGNYVERSVAEIRNIKKIFTYK